MAEHERINSILNFLRVVTKPFRWRFVAWFVLSMSWAVDTSLRPFVLKIILDRIASDQIFKFGLVWILTPIFLYIFLTVVNIVVSRLHNYVVLRTGPELKQYIATVLFEKTLERSFEVYQNNLSGTLSSKVNDVITSIPLLLGVCIEGFFYYFFIFISAIYTLSSVSFCFPLAVSVWILFVVAFTFFNVKHAGRLSSQSAEEWSSLSGRIVDIILNIMNVKVFSGKQHERFLFNNLLQKATSAEKNRNFFLLKLYAVHGFSIICLQGFSLFMLTKGVLNGVVTVGDFSLVLSINAVVADILWNVSQDFTTFVDNLGRMTQGLNSFAQIKDRPRLICSINGKEKNLVINNGKIVFDNVSFKYGENKLLFDSNKITLFAGQKIGLVGPSGSGKSTFVNLILRLFEISTGKILIDGQDISKVSIDSLNKSIAVIPQEPTLFNRSILENIRYGKLNATYDEIVVAAKKASAHEFIMSLPNDYNYVIGERGSKLSGGQRQRIAIARAILKNAKILIFDEATSALDPVTETQVQKSLLEISKEKTVVVIAHRLKTLLLMDRILVFEKGKIVGDGSHQELLQNCKEYQTLWRAHVENVNSDFNSDLNHKLNIL